MSNPEYVKVNDELYKINTDFRIAIECNKIALDKKIGDIERGLAIIYKLFGQKGFECNDIAKLLDLGIKYISLSNKEQNGLKNNSDDKFKLDISKCEGIIRSSFKFDYNYDPYELEYLHWYNFYNDLENLSTSEFGNCCILNRITNILNQDVSKIKDNKTRQQTINIQKILKQKYCINEEKELTEQEEKSVKEFYKALGINI